MAVKMVEPPKASDLNLKNKPLVPFLKVSAAIKAYPFPRVKVVMGIANGGIIPATLIAHHLDLPLRLIRVNYRNEENLPQRMEPEFLSPMDVEGLSPSTTILLVDDVGVTGKTLAKVKSKLSDFQVETLVLKGKADHVLLPELSTCVTWPWNIPQP
jgi:adenine/guanine phosphoribosyltransferase-like PRPP-binding protein